MGQSYALRGFDSIFAVPAAVVDKHIKLCSGVSLKVLLMLLRSPEAPPGINEMAARLGMSTADIADALGYWVEAGIITGGAAQNAEHPAVDKPSEASPAKTSELSSHKMVGRPRLPRREMLAIIEKNATLKGLVDEIQMTLGKPLTSVDMDAIVALFSYYGLSAHYIMTATQYCDAIGKLSMRYIEKTAASWQDQGVTSDNIDSHVATLLLYRTKESVVRRLLGIQDRALSASEQKFLDSWCNQMKMDPDIIGVAYDITVMQTGKLSFAYMNKILQNWHQKGVTDAKSAEAEHEAGKPISTSANTKTGWNPTHTKSGPDNKQSFDADRLEKLIESKLHEDGKGL